MLTYMAQNAYDFGVSGGDDEEVDIDVQNDSPTPYQVVQVGAAQADQSGEGKHMALDIIIQPFILLSNSCSSWP